MLVHNQTASNEIVTPNVSSGVPVHLSANSGLLEPPTDQITDLCFVSVERTARAEDRRYDIYGDSKTFRGELTFGITDSFC